MTPRWSHDTLLQPAEAQKASAARGTTSLPDDLVAQSAYRLRILALLYAFIFFMSEFLPAILFPKARAELFSHPAMWVPAAVSISVAIGVALALQSRRVPLAAVMTIGLVFEVAGSYGIATAEFLNPLGRDLTGRLQGLSWVAVWTLMFTIVVPTSPRRALLTALASITAVPVVISISMALNMSRLSLAADQFFFGLVLPYLLVVLMAYVGARVVYALGAEVKRARELGSYRLVERLGEGGMGEVWRAKHRLLARPAAIKLIRPELTGGVRGAGADVIRDRFEREAQAMASLQSPHTVNLFDFGVADDGAFYYVMELLEGLDAETIVRRFGPLPAARTIAVLRQACHSLSEAHTNGLVHRDIKPANIFLCRYGEEVDFVKVLDFGLVKAFSDVTDTAVALTREQMVQGTPAYIAPEQALGRADLDGRVDIYALGCVAYWLLTGRILFEADTPVGMLVHHAHTVPQPPSTQTELTIPPALDAVVLQCLAKDPADRPQSAKDLSARLGEIETSDPWTDAAAREWWTKHLPARDGAAGL